ncbi:MAG: type II toxin-antitoxin system VapC family toxin [Flammeovirgaceae bacterium]
MGTRYLIDTCIVIKYLEEVLPPETLEFIDKVVDEESIVSFITKIELLVWNPPSFDDIKIREEFLNGSHITYITEEIIEKAIQIRKEKNLKLPDAVIAASAMAHDFILLSENDKDFLKVEPLGLKYLNPKTAFKK